MNVPVSPTANPAGDDRQETAPTFVSRAFDVCWHIEDLDPRKAPALADAFKPWGARR